MKMKGAALFSGKDSLYSIYLAEKLGIPIDYLITFITTFNRPSGHLENINALKKIAEKMNKQLFIIDLKNGIDGFINLLNRINIDTLVSGDVFIEDHVKWLENICKKLNISIIEPIFHRSSLDILKEMMEEKFKAMIICIDNNILSEEWLGFILSKDTLDYFLSKNRNIDPLGENGEYHTLVLECPLYKNPVKLLSWRKYRVNNYSYIVCEID
ncbi:MAG: ATP pyrophosphatase [Candidatus Methanomethylicota archaeon]|uniref:ATP pyrophosphatase n=1 Tax=Thermoproteota archaeon TaxID=2056631 RepID=A0A520KG77_9CREN|nr:MAG: ATP pyrophosphatase [Candidatus Verstraetearchaeota archaeon]TDA38494.1 MAG: ATP pyrophosphatase [Candidatus Verstraetearchaeota archaeon]